MASLRTQKPKPIYNIFMKNLLKSVTPHPTFQPITVELINDVYLKNSVKGETRSKRGTNNTRVEKV